LGGLSPAGGLLRSNGDWMSFHQLMDCWDPMVIGCPFTSWWIVEKRSSFSYLGQNQKNDQQWLFCLFCAISQKFGQLGLQNDGSHIIIMVCCCLC
jgi:hypothetical protein